MYMGKNRRLANVKTRHETGLDYITQKLNIETPFGKKVLKDLKPYFPGEEKELREELSRVQDLVEYAKNNKRTIELLSEVFMEVKDAGRTAERAEKSVLTVLEIYEIKSLLLLMEKYVRLLQSKETSTFEHSNHCCLPGEEKQGDEDTEAELLIIGEPVQADALAREISLSGQYEKIRIVCPMAGLPEELLAGKEQLVLEQELRDACARADRIIADPLYRRLLPGEEGRFTALPHTAYSGRYYENEIPVLIGEKLNRWLPL